MKVVSIKSNDSAGHANREQPVAECLALVQAVRQIATDRRLAVFDRRQHMADLVENELNLQGLFRRTHGGRLFYFSNSERRLLDMRQQPFALCLKKLTGLAAPDQFFRFVLDRLYTGAEQAKPIEIQTLSHYNPETGLLVVSDGGRGVWRRELGGKWRRGLNGDDGVFFLTDIDAETWEPEFSGEHLSWFLDQFGFANDVGRLPRWDQAQWFLLNLLHCFFPPLRRTRMIPAFLGIQGSRKSTGLRLLGPV